MTDNRVVLDAIKALEAHRDALNERIDKLRADIGEPDRQEYFYACNVMLKNNDKIVASMCGTFNIPLGASPFEAAQETAKDTMDNRHDEVLQVSVHGRPARLDDLYYQLVALNKL